MTLKFSREKYFNGQQNTRNITDNWKMIKTFLQQAVEKHAPSKICKGNKSLPWITQSIRRMIRKRNKLHKRAKETGSGRLTKKWKQLGSDIKSEITSSHNKYVANMIGKSSVFLVNTPVNWSFSASALSTSLSAVVLFIVWCLEAEYSEYLFSLMIYTSKMVCCFL
jgi:hypothetical protein